MDEKGDVLAQHQGPRTVDGFKATVGKAQKYVDLKKVASPTPAQKLELFQIELEMGKLDLATARARKAELTGLTPEQEAKLSGALTDLEVMDALKSAQPKPGQEAALRAELGGRFHAMLQEGRRPTSDQVVEPFYSLILDWAEKEKNVAAFEQALGALRERFGSNPQAARFFKAQEERLARFKQ
jgi:hypothetical protein